MFADKTMQKCIESFTGLGPFQFDSNGDGEFDLWAQHFANGEDGFWTAESEDGTVWEYGYGALNTGTSPVQLSRTTLGSSNAGAPVDWQLVDGPVHVYSYPSAVAAKHMLAPLINGVANIPLWLPIGALWIDYSLGYTAGSPTTATAWVTKRYIGGTRTAAASHAEIERTWPASGISTASQRLKSVDKGAANAVFTADEIGKLIEFDCTAGVRSLTMLAHDAAGMGEGAYVFVRPYGSTANGVTFIPGGADTTVLATAPAGRVTKFGWSASKATWVADYVAPLVQVVRSSLAGLKLSNNVATPNTKLDVAAGTCADSTNAAMLALVAGTIDCGTAGAADGLDAGALANSTWYHVFAIGKTDGTTARLASTSVSTPTMPTGYTLKRRIGSFRTDGSAHILAFVQDGDYFRWLASVLDVNDTNPGTAAVLKTLTVPTGINVTALLTLHCQTGSNDFDGYASDPAANDEVPSRTAVPLRNFGGVSSSQAPAGQLAIRTNTSAQIRYRISASGGSDIVRMATLGWAEHRGRDA